MRHLILLLSLLAGCTATSVPRPTMVAGLSVVWEDDATQEEVQQAHHAIKYITSKFFEDHHIKPDLLTVSLSTGFWIYLSNGRNATGAYYRKNRLIRVVLGRWNTLPSLYHELCHVYFAPVDVDHENPNWDEWNDRAYQINDELLNE